MTEYIIKAAGWAIDYNGESAYKDCEEIVRCRDCTWLVETSNPISSTGWWCVTNDTPRSLDGFCDWGVRRNDTENGMEVE